MEPHEYAVVVIADDFVSTPTFPTREKAEAFVARVSTWLGGGAATFDIFPIISVDYVD